MRVSLDGGRTWDDLDAKTLTIPGAVAKAFELAADLGWTVSLAFAPGPPASVTLRWRNLDARGYALWNLEDGCNFVGGATSRLQHLPTLRHVHHALGVQCPHQAPLMDCVECARERRLKAEAAAAKRAATKAAKAAAA